MALGELKVEKRIIIRSIIGSPTTIALLVTLLLVVIGGGYWWMLSQPTPDDKAQSLISPAEQTAIPTLEVATDDSGDLKVDGTQHQSDEPLLDPSYEGATDDSSALPPVIIEDMAGVGTVSKDQQRVVITSDVVDALLDDKPESVDTSTIEAAVEENTVSVLVPESNAQQQVTNQENVQQPLSSSNSDAVAQAESVNEQETAPNKTITFSFAREELKALSPRAYTLQLGAMTSLEDVQSFIEQYSIQDQARIYPTVRNGAEWFIIVYQDYPTIQVARDSVETLPKDLQNLGPWAKSLNQVHREIDRVK